MDEIDNSKFNYNDYNFDYVAVVDRNTKKTVNTVDLHRGLDKELLSYEFISSVVYLDGKITVKTQTKERDYDPFTGELLDTRASNLKDFGDRAETYKVGDYVIEVVMNWDEYNGYGSCTLNVKSPDGKVESIALKEAGVDIYSLTLLVLSDTSAVIPVSTNKGNRFYELDLTTNKLTTAKADKYNWLDPDVLGFPMSGTDGSVYFSSGNSVYSVDASKKEIKEVFNPGWCSLNQGLMSGVDYKLVECSYDTLIFIGRTKPGSVYESQPSDFQIIEFVKADKNPNAGKTVLELYTDSLDANIGEAILMFNEKNDKYYIEISDRYDDVDFSSDYGDLNTLSDDEWDKYELDFRARMSNALVMDIMSGDGPDILVNTSNYSQLYNSDCLADLSPYVKKFDSDNYFTNIIEGAKTGDKLYQLPVSFAIYGVLTDAKEAGKSGVGFTLDEYNSFVKNALNGTDMIMEGQAAYFSKLFNSSREKFIVDGKADFSVPEFKELADYVKDNVPEKRPSWDDVTDEIYNYVEIAPFSGIGGFYHIIGGSVKDPTILGTPSLDGRGPMYTAQCSVAISAQAPNVDACGEFVKILLSDEIQSYIALNDMFVLNRIAYRRGAEAAFEYFNKGGSNSSMGFGPMSYQGKKFTDKEIDRVEKVVLSCTKIMTEDSAISMILIEEMPAYFLGQKDLDAVVKIAQNRAQKVLDERGAK